MCVKHPCNIEMDQPTIPPEKNPIKSTYEIECAQMRRNLFQSNYGEYSQMERWKYPMHKITGNRYPLKIDIQSPTAEQSSIEPPRYGGPVALITNYNIKLSPTEFDKEAVYKFVDETLVVAPGQAEFINGVYSAYQRWFRTNFPSNKELNIGLFEDVIKNKLGPSYEKIDKLRSLVNVYIKNI